MADDDQFKYKIDNSSMVTRHLSSILFSEEFADVVLICGGAESSCLSRRQNDCNEGVNRGISASQ